jgi:hypothetical protein
VADTISLMAASVKFERAIYVIRNKDEGVVVDVVVGGVDGDAIYRMISVYSEHNFLSIKRVERHFRTVKSVDQVVRFFHHD